MKKVLRSFMGKYRDRKARYKKRQDIARRDSERFQMLLDRRG